ncbi:MAG: hypothetical protein PHG24_02465 [Candidatus Pacebacteria bacterium]|nr:hypothetical protein [Candidatus Paceibacterota bacterium]
MLKRDIFIGLVIFMLFAIGLVFTLENINERETLLEQEVVD